MATVVNGILRVRARALLPARVWPVLVRQCRRLGGSVLNAYGTGRVQGTVSVITAPAPTRAVGLLDRESLTVVRRTQTAADGSYAFTDLDHRRKYLVVALDDQPGGYNAAVADYVTPTT